MLLAAAFPEKMLTLYQGNDVLPPSMRAVTAVSGSQIHLQLLRNVRRQRRHPKRARHAEVLMRKLAIGVYGDQLHQHCPCR